MMNIQKMKLKDLKPADYNPRKDLKKGDPEYEIIKTSIEQHGFLQPLVWNKRTQTLAGGHQRLKVLKDLGYKEVEVVIVDVDEKQEKAMNIAMNKASGEWDDERLTELLKQAKEENWLDMTGFNDDELDELLNEIDNTKEGLTDPDDVPETRKTDIKIGDVFELGTHRLMCGDSTDERQVKHLMNGNKADMVFTDPPYGIDYDNKKYSSRNSRTKKWDKIKNDELKTEELEKFCIEYCKQIQNYTQVKSSYYICFTARYFHILIQAMETTNIYISVPLVWVKQSATPTWNRYHPKHEMILYGGEGAKPTGKMSVWYGPKNETTIWEISREGNHIHPTQKPIELIIRALQNSSKINDKILDLFGGSGSTLISCEKIERKCFMMELDPQYVQVIIDRWEQFTGDKAKKI